MAINSIFFIFIIVILVFFVRNLGRIIPQRNLPWVMGGYFTILLISMLILPMLPKTNFPVTVSEKVLTQAKRGYIEAQNMALKGRPEQIDGVAKRKQWEFAFSGNQMEITGNNYDSGLTVAAAKKDTNDGKIEVIYYASKTILEGTDVTNEIKLPKVSLAGNILEITMPEQSKIEIAKFKKDFVMSQFSREAKEQELRNVIGAQVLYLRLPPEVQIGANKMGIQFVEKK